MSNKDYAWRAVLLHIIFCSILVVCGVFFNGCEFDSSLDPVISNGKTIYTVERFDPFMNDSVRYAVDKNTNVVYIVYIYSGRKDAITAAYNKDGTVMKLEDLTKLLEDK